MPPAPPAPELAEALLLELLEALLLELLEALLLELLEALLLELLEALLLELAEVEPPVPLPLTEMSEALPVPFAQNPQIVDPCAASEPLWDALVTLSCPPDGVPVAFQLLVTVEPLSATTTPQPVIARPPTFFTVTSAQYPVCHCDWNLSSADIVESGLSSSFSRETISSSSEDMPPQATRQQASAAEQRLNKLVKRMNFLLEAAGRAASQVSKMLTPVCCARSA